LIEIQVAENSFQEGEYTMKKVIMFAAVAAFGLGVSACDSPQENAVEDKAEAVEEAYDEKADQLEEKADAVEEAGEEKADAMEDQADTMDGAAPQ
jgi:hypothetical protein